MMKTPEEIKKGLEMHSNLYEECEGICPYTGSLSNGLCLNGLIPDALAYIQQLEQINADFAERTARLESQLATPYKQATMKDVAERLKRMGIDCCYGEDDHD